MGSAVRLSYQVFSEQIEEGRRHLRMEASEDVVAVAANDLRQFGILVCDNLRHFYKRPPWLIAGQQLVPARFRLQKLPPNLADPYGEVDMAVQLSWGWHQKPFVVQQCCKREEDRLHLKAVFLQSYLQWRSPLINRQASEGTALVTPGGRACQGVGDVSQGASALSSRSTSSALLATVVTSSWMTILPLPFLPWRCHSGEGVVGAETWPPYEALVRITASLTRNCRALDQWLPPDSLRRCLSVLSDCIIPSRTSQISSSRYLPRYLLAGWHQFTEPVV